MGPRHLDLKGRPVATPTATYDAWLLLTTVAIIALGLTMVASSSIVMSQQHFGYAFYFLIRQVIFLGAGLFLGFIIIRINTEYWSRLSGMIFLLGLLFLALVLVPGIGRSVNGSTRWIGIGMVGMQVSEFAKLAVIIYMASYLTRYQEEVEGQVSGFLKPLVLLGLVGGLLLLEPDFGATVVISFTVLGMMFLAGVRLRHFIVLLVVCASLVVFLAVSSPYRLQRLTTFLNPWSYQFDSGYQLTQSLIAFGRGGWLGVGLGGSVQKLSYLPEAHTDFLFAVLAEELGLIGVLGVLLLFALLVGRGFAIARRALKLSCPFQAYLAYGISLWIGMQAMVNIGVNSGVLPTKGLTLPLMSYGGSSLLIMCLAIALLMRVDHETRWQLLGRTG
jgi:cell division protein FtsW